MAWRSFWTQDRVIVLARDWAAGVPLGQLHVRLNMLDGQPLSLRQIQRMAARRHLRRPEWFRAHIASAREQSRHVVPVIVPATPKPPQRPRFPASRFSMLGGRIV